MKRGFRRILQRFQSLFKFAAGFGHVRCIKNGGNNANPARPGSDDFVEILQIDSADGEPRDFYIGRRPADVIEGDRLGRRLGWRRENRANGDVSRFSSDGAPGLSRRVSGKTDANAERGTRNAEQRLWIPRSAFRVPRFPKEILLAEMAEFRADLLGDVQMVVDDQADVGALENGLNLFGEAEDFVRRRILGAQLNQIRAAIAELLHDFRHIAPVQVSGVDEGVEAAVSEGFH